MVDVERFVEGVSGIVSRKTRNPDLAKPGVLVFGISD
jgi:hypothetical protein